APASGVLSAIKVNEDETVDVGTELAVIDDAATPGGNGSAPASATAAPEPEPELAAKAEPKAEPAAAPTAAAQPDQSRAEVQTQAAAHIESAPAPAPAAPAASTDGEHAYATPLVRKLAAEHNVDLATVTGTGLGGRIRKQDVLDRAGQQTEAPAGKEVPAQQASAKPAVAAPAPAVAAATAALRGKTEKLSRLRKVIAERMVESLQVSAQLTTVVEVDVTRVARLRQRAKSQFETREGTKLSFLPFFAVAAVDALKAHPAVNSSIDLEAGTVSYHEAINLGIAVDTERGLLVPVIHDAGDLNLGGFARKIADMAERTRANKVTPDELSGGTFTLTNTGSRGALFDTPIINQPQVAILGTGSVVKRPVVVDDPDLGEVIAIRSMAYLALTYDHRIVDGADAARYLLSV
ncbi:MAG: 2-oxoglutarate dehydrogenase, E2 component, dihydrolipoamide succinyltransferase, partial [Mycobacteriales bacterium]